MQQKLRMDFWPFRSRSKQCASPALCCIAGKKYPTLRNQIQSRFGSHFFRPKQEPSCHYKDNGMSSNCLSFAPRRSAAAAEGRGPIQQVFFFQIPTLSNTQNFEEKLNATRNVTIAQRKMNGK